ncbi:MAG: isopentenyl-diphosphate delta-isomerase [Bacteroidota bacterium]
MTHRLKEMDDKLTRPLVPDDDPTAVSRKRDHIALAFESQIRKEGIDNRFYYEPILSGHPEKNSWPVFSFLEKQMKMPLWVSSMTGGTKEANTINHNLAQACRDFGMGMGLGSCRSLLYSDEFLADFNVRSVIGDDLPLYANLGIAQLEQLIDRKELYLVEKLIEKLRADGLIIHVNPLQEWLQPEGDHFRQPPLKTIEQVLETLPYPIIVKEVGQGMGYKSLKALFQLPLAAIDFAANGGTNFAKLELLRSNPVKREIYSHLAFVGHSAGEMVDMSNRIIEELGDDLRCKQVIISGGIGNFLDGYYLINKLALTCIYGQASAFLRHARGSYEDLYDYVGAQVQGLALAKAYLSIKNPD